MKVLIVEDEPALRDVYVMLFKYHDFEVFEAANGKLGIAQLKAHQPDVIILDILMPVMGGIEFLKAVDISKNYPTTRVLVLSNLSDQKTLDLIKQLGADKYLLKSGASPKMLVDAVNKLAKPRK